MKTNRNATKTLLVAAASLALASCGSKSESTPEADAAAPEAPAAPVNATLSKLDSSGAVMNFAVNALSSSMKGSASSALALEGDQTSAHASFPQCSEHGEAYSQEEARRMEPSDAGFSEATLFCQLNVNDSAETILGSLTMAKKVLCTVEKSLGKEPEYTAEGKTYSNVKLKMSKDCGWSDKDIAEMSGQMPPATFVTKELAKGDWKRSVTIALAGMIDFKLFYTVDGDTLAIKKVEGWKQSERCAKSESSCNADVIPDSATGSRGDVIALNLKTGTLRAETSDNYWGRRARGLIKGTIGADGKFSKVTDIELLYSDTYVMKNEGVSGVYGKMASAKGTSSAGILYKGGQFACGGQNGCELDTFASTGSVSGPAAVCSKSGGCSGNTGFNFAFSNAKVLDFIRLGAGFDAKGGSRSKNEKWLESAGIPTFNAVDFGATID
ncbi:MAG: hypothetical protein IOD12_08405 [Silvanigrellales bacterium]|nr:hypothetical protein [Silvanigrellales bacterium]